MAYRVRTPGLPDLRFFTYRGNWFARRQTGQPRRAQRAAPWSVTAWTSALAKRWTPAASHVIGFSWILAAPVDFISTGAFFYEALKILEGVEGIGVVKLGQKDIVRHKLVTRIVNAYDKYDKERAEAREAQKTN